MVLGTQWDPRERSQTIRYKDNEWGFEDIRLYNEPYTLSGHVLRLEKNLPFKTGFWEVIGNRTLRVLSPPPLPDTPPPDDENLQV